MARNRNINIWYMTPVKESFDPQWGHNPLVVTYYSILFHSSLCLWLLFIIWFLGLVSSSKFLEFVAKHTFIYLFILLLSEGSTFLTFPFTSAILSLPWSSLPVTFARVLFYFRFCYYFMSSARVLLLSLKIIRYLRSSEPLLLTFSSVLSSLGPYLILFMPLLVGSLFGIAGEFHRLTNLWIL